MSTESASHLLLSFYGDDFTGSTDAMEVLEWAGIPTLLFLEPPAPEMMQTRFEHIRAVGVAGVSRSMTASQMDDELPPIFSALKALQASIVHYKVCSTFDSSSVIGSIGHATEIGLRIFGEQTVPLVVGAPFLRRYVAFSNLFARVDETTYRLDRHPTMSRHPVTPMDEADLRLHLAKQTSRCIGAMNVLHLEQEKDARRAYYERLVQEGTEIVVFDTMNDEHLLTIGGMLDDLAGTQPHHPLLVVGSSGVEKALTLHWQQTRQITPPTLSSSAGEVKQLIVVSGSASPITAQQIAWAGNNGFALIRLDSAQLIDPSTADQARESAIQGALEALSTGRNVVLYSAQGPDDPHIAQTKEHMTQLSLNPRTVGVRLGTQQGMILRALLERTGLRRAAVTGGDTCGYVARQLGIYALSAIMPLAPGAPLCRAYAADARFDGLEIVLKGGQFGQPDYFGRILKGSM